MSAAALLEVPVRRRPLRARTGRCRNRRSPWPPSRLNGAGPEPSETLYGGAAGGGKSDWLLMSALDYVDVPGYAALLLRRTYQDLAKPGALIDRAHSWLHQTDARWNEQKKQWRFPSGAVIDFGYLEQANDVYQYQSAEYQMVGFDELTQFEEPQYLYLFSRLRRLRGVPGVAADVRRHEPGRDRPPLGQEALPGGAGRRAGCSSPPGSTTTGMSTRTAYRASLSPPLGRAAPPARAGRLGRVRGAGVPRLRPRHAMSSAGSQVPAEWERVEGMDHGVNNPTCFLAAALDYDGNLRRVRRVLPARDRVRPRRRGAAPARVGLVADRRRPGTRSRRRASATRAIRNRFGIRDTTGRELSRRDGVRGRRDRDLARARTTAAKATRGCGS